MFDAVKGETCTRECLEGVSLPTCPAAGPVVSPDLAPVEAPALGPTISLYGAPAPASLTSKSIAYSQAQVSTTHAHVSLAPLWHATTLIIQSTFPMQHSGVYVSAIETSLTTRRLDI